MANKASEESKPKVSVGSGITVYERDVTIVDEPYRTGIRGGALVPSELPASPAKPLDIFRGELEEIASATFTALSLPDPFLLIHPEANGTPIKLRSVLARGYDHYVQKMESGYHLAAAWLCPPEDHSKLWFASRFAVELGRLDVLFTRAEAQQESVGSLVAYSAQIGAELGRLSTAYELKFANEKDALRGRGTVKSAAEGGKAKSRSFRKENLEAFVEMQRRLDRGENKLHAARQIVREFQLTVKPSSFVKSFGRYLNKVGTVPSKVPD